MAIRPHVTSLNAKSIDILNVIRQNATAEYQSLVPEVKQSQDIPKVGEVLMGYPMMANQFLQALVNRIALVRVKSATFNNDYSELKKGYIEFGETVEEVFVGICKAREFSVEKAEAREFKRTLPDVRSAFHTMNWRVQYPVTIQNEDLKRAFTSAEGVTDLIARIVDAVYTSAEYDEYLLFKYLLIKAVAHGKMFPVPFNGANHKDSAKKFRGISNNITFMQTKYNITGVHTTTPKEDQYIFMDSMFNAEFDVDVLASAFNMDKATFMGKLKLIDDWTTFDNDRFKEIMDNTTQIEEVTAEELTLMKGVKAVMVDSEWFQIYDNHIAFTETYVASGEYWNYFYNNWKTVSSSPFSNAVVFIDTSEGASVPAIESFNIEIAELSIGENATTITVVPAIDEASFSPTDISFEQDEDSTTKGIGVHKYGAYMLPPTQTQVTPICTMGGETYYAQTPIDTASAKVGDVIQMGKSPATL